MTRQLKKDQVDSIRLLLKKGLSIREVAIQKKVSKSVVQKISKGCERPKAKIGRPRKLSPTNINHCVTQITRGVAKNATDLAKSLERDAHIHVDRKTVARALLERGLSSKQKKEKPLLSKKNIKARLSFAKEHKDWTVADWRTVIFSDETKINRFNSDGRVWCWSRDDESIKPENVKQTVKHGGGNVKLWGCMTASGVGGMCKIDNILDSHLYLEILQVELAETFDDLELDRKKFTFQQDNDPKHTANIIKEYLATQVYDTMTWPAQSPDMNPIEHLWAHIKCELNKYEKPASGMKELWERIQDVWLAIKKETCLNLIDSMPKRMQAVIKAKGYWTKY